MQSEVRVRRLRGIGAGLLGGGLAVLLFGTFRAPSDSLVGLVALLVVPPVVALAGAVVLLPGFIGRVNGLTGPQIEGRIIGVGALIGVGVGLIALIADVVSLLPGWAIGLTGIFGAGFAVGVAAAIALGLGLLLGLGVGLVIGIIWWLVRGRHLTDGSKQLEPDPYGIRNR